VSGNWNWLGLGPDGRARWWIARQLDRGNLCWTDLVLWALGRGDGHISPGATCRKDAAERGGCFCGKYGADGETNARLDGGAR
jgi:hypothetical protein